MTSGASKAVNGRIGVTMRHFRLTIVAFDKTVSRKYSECVFVALVTRRETRMRRDLLTSVASVALTNVST